MAKSKLGLEPAFACTYEIKISGENKLCYHEGMSKRFYAACVAMQGILANERLREKLYYKEKLVEYSYNVADELLRQENL
jgi:hypothetical protein